MAIAFLAFSGTARADNYGWCPDNAVCSDQYNKRVIVYDPNGYFRQTTLMSRDVPIKRRNPNAEKYDRQAFASDTYVINGVAYKREYFFRPAGDY
jgi:hypothetical protein